MSGGGKGVDVVDDVVATSHDADIKADSIRSSRVVPAVSEVSYEDELSHMNESGLIVPVTANHWNPAEVLEVNDIDWENADYSDCQKKEDVKIYLAQLSTLLRVMTNPTDVVIGARVTAEAGKLEAQNFIRFSMKQKQQDVVQAVDVAKLFEAHTQVTTHRSKIFL